GIVDGDEDVLGFQVAVRDAGDVDGVERAGERHERVLEGARRDRAAFGDVTGERREDAAFYDDERAPVVQADVVASRDAVAPDLRDGFRRRFEARPGALVAAERGIEELERRKARLVRRFGFVNDRKLTLAEYATDDPARAEQRPGRERGERHIASLLRI